MTFVQFSIAITRVRLILVLPLLSVKRLVFTFYFLLMLSVRPHVVFSLS